MVSYCGMRVAGTELTGRTVTRIVASRATIKEIMDKVSMTRYSCFCGVHSSGISLTASRSLETGREGFSTDRENVDVVRLVSSLGTAIVLVVGSFSAISEDVGQ
jgi:hypothetical protein